MKVWPVMAAAVLAAVAALGAETPEPEHKPPKIVVEPPGFDFGQAQQNQTLSKDFVIRNEGGSELVIEEIQRSCGCTAAVAGSHTVTPGAKTPLKVTLTTGRWIGRVERTVTIRSNDPARPALAVRLSVTVAAPKP